MRRHVDVDLWTYVKPGPGGGGSLPGAVDYLIPAFESGAPSWHFKNIRDTDAWRIAVYLMHAAAEEAADAKAATASSTPSALPMYGVDMWPLVPACSPVDGKNVDEI